MVFIPPLKKVIPHSFIMIDLLFMGNTSIFLDWKTSFMESEHMGNSKICG